MSFTYIKCTDCGRMQPKKTSLKKMGILDGYNCPYCGGEIILLHDDLRESYVSINYR